MLRAQGKEPNTGAYPTDAVFLESRMEGASLRQLDHEDQKPGS